MNTVERWKQEKHPLDVVDDVIRYAERGYSIKEIEREAGEGEWERFKWAGLYTHGHHPGYFMLRTKIPGGRLTPAQAETIGSVAGEFARAPDEYGGETQNQIWGDGFLDITTRQDIQMHWIEIGDIPEIWSRYDAVGLTTIQGCGDGARNVLGCPAAGLTDHEHFNAHTVVEAVSDFFTGDREYANLPRKFKMTITGCGQDCAQSQINDLGLTPARKTIDGADYYGFHAKVGGGLSDGPRMATTMDVFVLPEDTVEFARAVAQTFKELGDRTNRGVCRLRYLVQQLGTDQFEDAVRTRCEIDLLTRGIDLTDGYRGDHIGVHDQKQTGLRYVGHNVIAGRLGGDEFIAAARAAERHGTSETTIRLATDQNFLITHIPRERVDALLAEPFARKYEADPGAFARGAVACTGSEFCNYGIIETKNRVYRWATALDRRIDVPADIDAIRIHMSGCSASCAQPQIADIGFRGETVKIDDPEAATNFEGDAIVEGMDVGLGGTLGTDNAFIDWIETAVPAGAVIPALEELFAAYGDDRDEGEPFSGWCRRVGTDHLRAVMQRANEPVSSGVAHGG